MRMQSALFTAILLLAAPLGWSAASLYAQPDEAIGMPFDAYVWRLPYQEVVVLDYALGAAERERLREQGCSVSLAITPPQGAPLAKCNWPLNTTDLRVTHQWKQALAEGEYQARVAICAADGTVLHRAENVLLVRSYAFEHNDIGKDRIVIPPFEPVRVEDGQATVWGRTFRFGQNGLPRAVTALGQPLLAESGVCIESQQRGKRYALETISPFAMTATDGYDGTGSANGHLGGLSYRIEGRLDYDGFYRIRLTLAPRDGPVAVDALTLRIPFAGQPDTFSFQKNDRDIRQHGGLARFGGIHPGQAGTIFDARSLPPMTAYNCPSENFFVPAIYVGFATRGLWYYAESDWEWYLNPEKEHATLERVDGTVQLRVLLVNDTLEWRQKRTFEFALMPQPVKPQPAAWRKIAWAYPEKQYVHDTSGWRYYGDGVNAFTLPSDAHYQRLGRVLAGEEKPEGPQYGNPVTRPRDDPRPLVLYGSSLMAGTGPAGGEWDSYAAEWVSPAFARRPPPAKSLKESVASKYGGKRSFGGFLWEEDISLHPTGINWTDSWLDFHLYYHQKLVRFARVSGTWFDNQSCFTIDDYNAEGLCRRWLENPLRFRVGGRPWNRSDHQPPRNYGRRNHIFQFRELTRRLATMCHQEGVAPFWLVNNHPTWSFCQMAWHMEGDYYCWGEERDLVDHAGLHGFRALVRSQGGLIPILRTSVARGTQPPVEGRPDSYHCANLPAFLAQEVDRTHVGLCLLHDIGMEMPWYGHPRRSRLLKQLDERFGFFDDEVAYVPYTEQALLRAESKRVFASLFHHRPSGRVLAVVFNEKKGADGITTKVEIAPTARGVPGTDLVQAEDLESTEPLVDFEADTAGIQTVLHVPGRGMRLLLLRGEEK